MSTRNKTARGILAARKSDPFNSLQAQGYAKRRPGKFSFNRNLLPQPAEYFKSQGLSLTGGGEWKNALCPFHNDTKPSLRVRLDTGGFRCMVCRAKGGDVLAFHM